MSEAYSITIPPEAEATVKRLRDQPGLGRALARTMDFENQLTIGHIQQAYMSFAKDQPTTLQGTRVISNRLRGSVNASKSVPTANGVESSLGSNVSYAARQELGYEGTVTISAHSRKTGSLLTENGRMKTYRAIESYTQHVDQPGRHMFGKGIKDRLGDYSAAFLQTVLQFEKGDN